MQPATIGILVAAGIIVLLAVIIGIYLWATYNSLVTLKVRVDEAWSDITVQLKRRADLIPNIIEAVKGYAAHESKVFQNVTQARAETLGAQTPAEARTSARPTRARIRVRAAQRTCPPPAASAATAGASATV